MKILLFLAISLFAVLEIKAQLLPVPDVPKNSVTPNLEKSTQPKIPDSSNAEEYLSWIMNEYNTPQHPVYNMPGTEKSGELNKIISYLAQQILVLRFENKQLKEDIQKLKEKK